MAKKIETLKVKRVVEAGYLDIKEGQTGQDIIDSACDALDDSDAFEMIGGGILFQGEDGKWYTVTVEAVVSLANPEFVKDALGRENPGISRSRQG